MSVFCRDCKFFEPPFFGERCERYRLARCGALLRPDPVSGLDEHRSCDFARMPGAECGPDAALFVSRVAPPREQVRAALVASLAVTA